MLRFGGVAEVFDSKLVGCYARMSLENLDKVGAISKSAFGSDTADGCRGELELQDSLLNAFAHYPLVRRGVIFE